MNLDFLKSYFVICKIGLTFVSPRDAGKVKGEIGYKASLPKVLHRRCQLVLASSQSGGAGIRQEAWVQVPGDRRGRGLHFLLVPHSLVISATRQEPCSSGSMESSSEGSNRYDMAQSLRNKEKQKITLWAIP